MASNHLKLPPHLINSIDNVIDNVIDMPNNVHDNNDNDVLAHIDPDRYIDKKSNCNNYTIKEFNGNLSGLLKFSIFHTNITSLKQNLIQLKNFLGTLNNDFSIIGLSKTWGKSINIDLQTISGYNHYHCTRAKHRSGGGTSLYLKKSISFKHRPDLELKKNMFESSVIEIEKNVMNSKCNIIVGILYRSPNFSLSAFMMNWIKC